jgi:hypothetical protein
MTLLNGLVARDGIESSTALFGAAAIRRLSDWI